jgi:hypothetical protein
LPAIRDEVATDPSLGTGEDERMVCCSPRIAQELVWLVGALDDGSRPIAEIWRELGRVARVRKLAQPSYESVRRLVHSQRQFQVVVDPERTRLLAILLGEYTVRPRDPRELAFVPAEERLTAQAPVS